MLLLDIALIIFFILMNAFFVLAEFASVRVRKSQLEILASEGSARARYAQKVAGDLNSYLSACQLGITIASMALGWLGEPTVASIIGPFLEMAGMSPDMVTTVSFAVGFLLITMLHIVLGEMVPKSMAILSSEKSATATAPMLVLFYRATYPVMWVFNHTTNGLLRLMGFEVDKAEAENAHSDEEIRLLVEESYEQGLIDKAEYTYVDNIFECGDKVVRDIMMPRTDMVVVFRSDEPDEMINTAIREKYTRYPVCDGNRDNVVGFINVRDLYEKKLQGGDFLIADILRPIISVPDSMPINDLLKRFQKEKENIAIVIDEYGGTAGLVTTEDVLEEIVGSISDEYDEEEKEVEALDESTFLIKGMAHIDCINDVACTSIESGEQDTLNGFLIAELGRIPSVKERPVIRCGDLVFTIEKMSKNRILQVRMVKLPPSEERPDEGQQD